MGLPDLDFHKKTIIRQMENKKETADRTAKINKLKQKGWEKRMIPKSMEEYASEAKAALKDEEMKLASVPSEDTKDDVRVERAKKNYLKELQKVIEQSDVILQVLDGRDPMGCRNKELESHIIGKNKKLILVLNKIDLIPAYASAS